MFQSDLIARNPESLVESFKNNNEIVKRLNAQYPYKKDSKIYTAKLYKRSLLKELIGYIYLEFMQPMNNRTKMIEFDENWKNPETVYDISDFAGSSNSFIEKYFGASKQDIKNKNCAAHYFWYWYDTNANVSSLTEVFGKNFDLEKIRKEIIFIGPPGTGKTRYAMILANALTNFDDTRIVKIQFHPNYGYENFIEGFRPIYNNGDVNYRIEDGVFLKFLRRAELEEKNSKFVFIIDEINRADISRVFGELLLMLEYRDPKYATLLPESSLIADENDREIRSMKKCWDNNLKEPKYWVPNNVYVIGTMNTLDKSLVQIDFAFRRRFFWFPVPYDEKALLNIISSDSYFASGEDAENDENLDINKFMKCCTNLNRELRSNLGEDYEIGHAFFMKIIQYTETDQNIEIKSLCGEPRNKLWKYDIEPLIKEFLGTRAIKDLKKYENIFKSIHE